MHFNMQYWSNYWPLNMDNFVNINCNTGRPVYEFEQNIKDSYWSIQSAGEEFLDEAGGLDLCW